MGELDIQGLLTEEEAVSPVIGIILMVAITVILASIVGVFAFDVFGQNSEEAPGIIFEYDYDDGANELTIRHQNGDVVKGSSLTFKEVGGSSPGDATPSTWGGSEVQAGDTEAVGNVNSDAEVLIVWEQQQQGEDTAVIGTWEGPDA
jgi:flagellin-like protein